jgi:hypothetical protein
MEHNGCIERAQGTVSSGHFPKYQVEMVIFHAESLLGSPSGALLPGKERKHSWWRDKLCRGGAMQ